MSERIIKVNENIKKYINEYIVREVETPFDFLITLTHVETSRDLKHAKIFISVIPDNKRGTALKLLNKYKKGFISYLNKNLYQKNVPAINFAIDEQEVYGQEVDMILDNLK